jgi:Amt family ammonium transporter
MKRGGKLFWASSAGVGLLSLLGAPLALAEELAAPSQGAAGAIDPGATAWILASSALVLLMTPGLALFYGGMVRSKNVLGTMMQSVFCMGLVTVQWVLFGYTIAFGDPAAGGLFGDTRFAFLSGVPHDAPFPGTAIPHMAQMSFQLMFAIVTPALITGAFAERVRFGGFVAFVVLWTTFVYDPVAHWVWGNGILSFSEDSWLRRSLGTGGLDFAGGTVVHILAGVSALVLAAMLGKRRGYPSEPILPNNLVLTVLGSGILWFGWFGFNGGSALGSNGQAALAFTVTQICAASAAVSWAAVEWLHRGKASVLGVATGLVAGLVCITPASGYVTVMPALFMGLMVSPICYFFVAVVKAKLGYDDSLDAFGIHGVGGAFGALCTGLLCSEYLPEGATAGLSQFLAQLLAVVITILYATLATTAIVYVVDKLIGLRVSPDEEVTGLDLTQHGERGYSL